MFEIEPDAVAATFTSNDTDTDAPDGTPAAMVHVIVEPETDTVHGATPATNGAMVGHAAVPPTSVVPAGTVSVTITGAVDAAPPVFLATSV